MTVYEDEIPARRRGVGTKVLALACGILAILGSFWGIVWFIRSYVEPPRVMMPAGVKLASRDSLPVVPPATPVADTTVTGEIKKPTVEAQTPPPPAVLQAAPPPRPATMAKDPDQPAGSVADRWGPMNQLSPAPTTPAPALPAPQAAAPAPPPPAAAAPAPAETVPAALATNSGEKEIEEVAEGSVPAFDGPAPLPRRRPVMTARRSDPPLPRPRPDGQVAPQSVFIAVPTTDDRYPTGQ